MIALPVHQAAGQAYRAAFRQRHPASVFQCTRPPPPALLPRRACSAGTASGYLMWSATATASPTAAARCRPRWQQRSRRPRSGPAAESRTGAHALPALLAPEKAGGAALWGGALQSPAHLTGSTRPGTLLRSFVPSAFQIRYSGVKGMVAVDPGLSGRWWVAGCRRCTAQRAHRGTGPQQPHAAACPCERSALLAAPAPHLPPAVRCSMCVRPSMEKFQAPHAKLEASLRAPSRPLARVASAAGGASATTRAGIGSRRGQEMSKVRSQNRSLCTVQKG